MYESTDFCIMFAMNPDKCSMVWLMVSLLGGLEACLHKVDACLSGNIKHQPPRSCSANTRLAVAWEGGGGGRNVGDFPNAPTFQTRNYHCTRSLLAR